MSSMVLFIRESRGLLEELGALLKLDSADALVDVARELGAEAQVNAAIEGLIRVLGDIRMGLEPLAEPLSQVSALAGLTALVRPLIRGVAAITEASGDEFAALGMGDVLRVTDPIADAIELGEGLLGSAEDVLTGLPTVDDLHALQEEIAEIQLALGGYLV